MLKHNITKHNFSHHFFFLFFNANHYYTPYVSLFLSPLVSMEIAAVVKGDQRSTRGLSPPAVSSLNNSCRRRQENFHRRLRLFIIVSILCGGRLAQRHGSRCTNPFQLVWCANLLIGRICYLTKRGLSIVSLELLNCSNKGHEKDEYEKRCAIHHYFSSIYWHVKKVEVLSQSELDVFFH